jgi:hypothetical protein
LDVNHDGFLDPRELARFLELSPDLEMVVQLGQSTQKPFRELSPREGGSWPLLASLRQTGSATVLLTVRDCQVEVRATEPQGSLIGAMRVREIYLSLFRAADAKQKGFVVANDLKGDEFQILRIIFPLADRDEDGKLTEKELTSYLDLFDQAATACTVFSIGSRGRGLFEFIDSNRDGRLGVRELRTAWDRLSPWDRNGDGLISREEIPLQFYCTLSRLPSLKDPANQVPVITVHGLPPGSAPIKGPLWFRKMDRNGDGDVSPREFLGTREDFKRIDTDGDGLIDPQEAERANAWFRK